MAEALNGRPAAKGVDTPFGCEIDRRLAELQGPAPSMAWKLLTLPGIGLVLLVAGIAAAIFYLPNALFDPSVRQITLTLGFLAVWRYSWWALHAVRAERFSRVVYPDMRRRADAAWDAGWRPRTLHFMMTTYNEKPEITKRVIDSIVHEIRESGLAAHIWVGTASSFDEQIISEHLLLTARTLDADLTFVRQNQPGKRMAIGAVLRAIRRSNAGRRDLVVFMDGDAILLPGAMQKCGSLFGADAELQALTTDEEVICFGPKWMDSWLKMRFAQRRVGMQSHALAGKVLTLTGRMSVFRGHQVVDPRFIRMIEADHLNHWLWGKFRFLSGDDKSTWYYLLTQSAKMTYVPDALVATIEVIDGSGRERMIANLRRWSGNMLRNGARAIALGPRVTGGFIWFCLIDQRIAMWTTLVSPVLAIYGTIMLPAFAVTAILWVFVTRTVLSCSCFAGRVQLIRVGPFFCIPIKF